MSARVWAELRARFHAWSGVWLPDSLGRSAVHRLAELAAGSGAATEMDYLRRLDGEPRARQPLIDALSIGTTWFMRDPDGLVALADALQAIAAERGDRRVHVWSAGCSTGEEPYSLAILLLERGLRPRILATDINRRALRVAVEGRYGARPTRTVPARLRRAFFESGGDGRLRVTAAARESVVFELHNFASNDEPPRGWRNLDAVVCRNALMYFDRDVARAVIARLARSCRAEGLLLLGATERPLFWMVAGASAAEASPSLLRVPADAPVRSTTPTPPRSAASRWSSSAASAACDLAPALVAPGHEVGSRAVTRAEELERTGRLADALRELDVALAATPLYGPAHLARGLLLKRAGQARDAIDALRAARFLSPNAWLAPYQLGVCLDAVGSTMEAREAYRHALDVIETGGDAGSATDAEELERMARTIAEACRMRLTALADRELSDS